MSRRRLGFLLIICVVVIAALFFVLRAVRKSGPEPVAKIQVNSGDVTLIQVADKGTQTLAVGSAIPLNVGDSLQAHGDVTILFTGASLELPSGAELMLTKYTSDGSEADVIVTLKAGQVLGKVVGYNNYDSGLTVTTDAGTLVTRAGEFIAAISQSALSEFGVLSGAAQISGSQSANGPTVNLTANQGNTISAEGIAAAASLWAPVNLTTFRPDGSTVPLPAMLVNIKTHDSFSFNSGEPFLAPAGTYDLEVKVLSTYKASGITLKPGVANDLPITMAESVFTVVDETGKPINVTGLSLSADENLDVATGTPILVSPGESTIIVARDEERNSTQPVNLNLEPGQRGQIALHASFFGGGRVRVNIIPPNGIAVPAVTASIYTPKGEGNPPLQTFRTDAISPFLAPGDYVVVVPTQIAARYPVTIAKNQDVTLTIQLSTLVVNYTDVLGRTTVPFIFVAASAEMQRLGLTIDRMTQTPYALSTRAGTTIVVPAGNYTIRIDDKKDVDVPNVQVDPGTILVLPVKAVP